MIVAGIDEAGYGPTLGPLVVSVSAFRLPDPPGAGAPGGDLWDLLSPAVSRERDGYRIRVDDSKRLFQQRKGLRDLEEGLLPFLSLGETPLPRDLRALLRRVARPAVSSRRATSSDPSAYLDDYPWYRGGNLEIPVETFSNFVRSRARQLGKALEGAGVECLGLAARPIDVLEFNRQLDRDLSKARVSFRAIGEFISRLFKRFPAEEVEVTVDRQGGRTHYGPLLFEAVRPRGIRIETQDAERSVYELVRRGAAGASGRPVPRFRALFEVESESRHFAVALASMLSKYLREAHMLLFNRFWREHRGDLKPTAGYAKDARRFLADIHPLRDQIGVDDALLVRKR